MPPWQTLKKSVVYSASREAAQLLTRFHSLELQLRRFQPLYWVTVQ